MERFGYDDTNGIVIGEILGRYRFFRNNQEVIPFQWFRSDGDAIEWVKVNYPEEFKKGLEMRVYN